MSEFHRRRHPSSVRHGQAPNRSPVPAPFERNSITREGTDRGQVTDRPPRGCQGSSGAETAGTVLRIASRSVEELTLSTPESVLRNRWYTGCPYELHYFFTFEWEKGYGGNRNPLNYLVCHAGRNWELLGGNALSNFFEEHLTDERTSSYQHSEM